MAVASGDSGAAYQRFNADEVTCVIRGRDEVCAQAGIFLRLAREHEKF